MTRSKIRENVFKMLFRVEFHDKSELAEQMELLNDELTNPTDEEKQYIDEKCSAIIEHMAELDALIDEKSTGWKTNRMANFRVLKDWENEGTSYVVLELLKLRTWFEQSYKDCYEQAVELAKKYGADESGAFVNGVLAKFA